MKAAALQSICLMAMAVGTNHANAADAAAPQKDDWVNISDAVTRPLTEAGTKIPWPGQTSGVAVDRGSGDLYMDVTGLGLWKSSDHGEHFARIAEGQISGRCEYGYALYPDPAGSRLACFMLDGKCGMTLDAGKTWQAFAGVGRNWDFGAVDWQDAEAKFIFAIHHESGGEIYLSHDAGKNWIFLGKHPEFTAVGVFGDRALVAAKKEGIVRSSDAGKTWNIVSNEHPVGRVAIPLNGRTYWLAEGGLITTKDDGATWQKLGKPIQAAWGPIFGDDGNKILVADLNGFIQSTDGGQTWTRIAAMPEFKEMPPHQPGQFLSIGWDAKANILYASRMANPTFRLQLK